ncbi:hypothetical protein TrVGV298_002470 [Trichoderma virens]|nr:hypothetical protein TrVGV298_002470 [Trichoderma virens]
MSVSLGDLSYFNLKDLCYSAWNSNLGPDCDSSGKAPAVVPSRDPENNDFVALLAHVVKVLTHVARKEDDPRAAAAAFELAVCYSSGVHIPQCTEVGHEEKLEAEATDWLALAARNRDQRTPEVEVWLCDLIKGYGCILALDLLALLNKPLHEALLRNYQKTYSENSRKPFQTRLFIDAIRNLSDPLNHHDDTMLHYAVSTGDFQIPPGIDSERHLARPPEPEKSSQRYCTHASCAPSEILYLSFSTSSSSPPSQQTGPQFVAF